MQRLDWSYRADYVRSRAARRVGDRDVEPAWADEAFADPDALIDSPDPASKTGHTDRLIGWSPTARAVLVVVYLREPLIATNAWFANPTQRRRYFEQPASEEDPP